MELPLQRMSTQKHWADLVLGESTLRQMDELRSWLQPQKNVSVRTNRLRPGQAVLFDGPVGTDKSLAAAVLAREISVDIYRVDISKVVSRYIGETEKNIDRIFDYAGLQGWIMFFDEADALFGRRTDVKDSHDRYADIGGSYLLKRIEDYPGLAILATNLKPDVDDVFLRRFRAVLSFPSAGLG